MLDDFEATQLVTGGLGGLGLVTATALCVPWLGIAGIAGMKKKMMKMKKNMMKMKSMSFGGRDTNHMVATSLIVQSSEVVAESRGDFFQPRIWVLVACFCAHDVVRWPQVTRSHAFCRIKSTVILRVGVSVTSGTVDGRNPAPPGMHKPCR